LTHIETTVAEVQSLVMDTEKAFQESKDKTEHVLQLLTAQQDVIQVSCSCGSKTMLLNAVFHSEPPVTAS